MAIARDASATYDGGPAASTQTIAYTVGATANAFLGLTWESRALGTDSITGITYNGVAMTRIQGVNEGSGANYLTSWGLFIAAPDGNSHNIVISYGTNDYGRGVIFSYNGVAQAYDAHVERSGTSTSYTDGITPVASGCWAVLATANIGTTFSAGTGSNSVVTTTRNTTFDSNGTITAGVQYDMSISTASNLGSDLRSQFTLAPVVASTVNSRTFFRFA